VSLGFQPRNRPITGGDVVDCEFPGVSHVFRKDLRFTPAMIELRSVRCSVFKQSQEQNKDLTPPLPGAYQCEHLT
jgi:hypothetical protein